MRRDELWPHVNRWTLVLRRPCRDLAAGTPVRVLWFGHRYVTVTTAAGGIFQLGFDGIEVKS